MDFNNLKLEHDSEKLEKFLPKYGTARVRINNIWEPRRRITIIKVQKRALMQILR